jgi:hypothetical protein
VNLKVQNLAFAIAAEAVIDLHAQNYPINLFVHDSIGIAFESEEEARAEEPVIASVLCSIAPARLLTHFGVDFDMPLAVEFSHNYK